MAHNQKPIRVRPKFSPQSKREVKRDTPLRQARTCYGHLAGVAGMALMDEMLGLKWLEETLAPAPGNRVGYTLTPKGLQAMERLGVPVAEAAKSTGNFAFGCLDWTEPGHHLGGSLGRAVTTFLADQGFVGRTQGIREVTLQGSPNTWLNIAAAGD
ncbi:MAG: hypothetical protein CL902_10365 [Dehalococcoidia bacterium]|nr:hypothetical protein [Dehalococcoidia bacterium]